MILNRFFAQSWLSLLVKITLKSCSAFRCSHNPSSGWMHSFHPYMQGSSILPSVLILARSFQLSWRNSWYLDIILNACPSLCELFNDRLLNVLKRTSKWSINFTVLIASSGNPLAVPKMKWLLQLNDSILVLLNSLA